jgi:hypothetical protein
VFEYRAKQNVRACQWTGENLEELRWLLKGVVENDIDGDPCVYREYIEPYFTHYRGKTHANPGYYMLQFYAGDDMEVDPGRWVVVYEDSEVELMDDEQFNKMFEAK